MCGGVWLVLGRCGPPAKPPELPNLEYSDMRARSPHPHTRHQSTHPKPKTENENENENLHAHAGESLKFSLKAYRFAH